jgi:hypothetical protein
MSSFKYKSDRVKYRSDIKTLDELHTEHVSKFKNQKDELPQKRKRLNALKNNLQKLEQSGKQYTIDEIKKRAKLKREIRNMESTINNVKDNHEEIEYFSKTYDVILNYYDITEGKYYNNSDSLNGQIDSSEKSTSHTDKNNIDTANSKSDDDSNSSDRLNISNRLMQLNEISKQRRKVKRIPKKRKINNNTKSKSILSFMMDKSDDNIDNLQKVVSNRATLQDEYLTLIDENYVCSTMEYTAVKHCTTCDVEMTLFQSEGLYVCQKCGNTEYVVVESEILSHKDAINEKPKYPYKKINHLIEKLNQFQSKETANIPNKIIETVNNEIKKHRINKENVTLDFVKQVLKKYKYNSYYENKQYIFSRVTNTPPPILTREQEDEIKRRFRMIDAPFQKHRPKGRISFLNYSFVLHKLFKIMNMHDHVKYFTLLKSKEKLEIQDKIWKKICNDLKWPFHSSQITSDLYKIKF